MAMLAALAGCVGEKSQDFLEEGFPEEDFLE
jgi:hypothetical protein